MADTYTVEQMLERLNELRAIQLDCLRRIFKGDMTKAHEFARRMGIDLGVH